MSILEAKSGARAPGRPQKRSFLPAWLKKFLSGPRSVRVTREGFWYIAAVLVTGAIAINTGNNLLYLVLATLLSIIILSGIMSELTMRGIRIGRRLPRRLFRNTTFTNTIIIENRKRLIPSICFRVYELPCQGLPDTHTYVVKVSAGERTTVPLANAFTRRGLMEMPGFKITTTFPFGLFLKSRIIASPEKVLVYPAIKPVSNLRITEGLRASGGASVASRGSGTGLYNIRQYTQNDDARHIHWKSAARTTRLMVKEFEHETERSVVICFQNLSDEDVSEAFEDAVDEVAGMSDHFIERGWAVGLETLSGTIVPGRGEAHLYNILEFLAYIRPAGRGAPSIKVQEA